MIRELAERVKVPLSLDWTAVSGADSAPVYNAWLELAPVDRERFEAVLRGIHDLATSAGVGILVEEALYQGHNITDEVATLEGHHAKGVWAFLRYPEVFRTTRNFMHSDNLPSRYWRIRMGFPEVMPNTSREACMALQNALSWFYRLEQGRGQRVTVEYYCRQGKQHYYFVYPDDYTGTYVGHNDQGRLMRKPQRPTFEIVYLYDPAAGSLELYAQGDKHVRAALEHAFCEHILGCEPAAPTSRPPYELNGLLDRAFPFPHDPADGITDVRVRRLRVSVPGSGRRMTLEANLDRGPGDIQDMIDEWVNGANVPRSRMVVTQAAIRIEYRSAEDKRGRSLTVIISYPDSCDLKGKPEEQRELGEKYLRRWGIARE